MHAGGKQICHLCVVVSGDWEAAAQRSAANAAAGDGDNNEVFGDFEDVETGAGPVRMLGAMTGYHPVFCASACCCSAEEACLCIRKAAFRSPAGDASR